MSKITLKNTVFANGFVNALQRLLDADLEIDQSYALSKFARQFREKQGVYNEARQKLIDKYGTKDDDGKLVEENGQVQVEDVESFQKEFQKLLEVEEEYEMDKLHIEDLQSLDIRLSANDILLLDKILED
jgi:uncharacterized Zn finger protein